MPTKKPAKKSAAKAKSPVKAPAKKPASVSAVATTQQAYRLQMLLVIFAMLCLAFFAVVVWRYHG